MLAVIDIFMKQIMTDYSSQLQHLRVKIKYSKPTTHLGSRDFRNA